MPRGRKKIVEDIGFISEIEKLMGRPLTSKEKQDLAISAKNFVRDNFAVTSVYDAETIEEACAVVSEPDPLDKWDAEEESEEEDGFVDDYSGKRGDYND